MVAVAGKIAQSLEHAGGLQPVDRRKETPREAGGIIEEPTQRRLSADMRPSQSDGMGACRQCRLDTIPFPRAQNEQPFSDLRHSERRRVQDGAFGSIAEALACPADQVGDVDSTVVQHAGHVLDEEHTGIELFDSPKELLPQTISGIAEESGIRERIQLAPTDARERLARRAACEEVDPPAFLDIEQTPPADEVYSPDIALGGAKRKEPVRYVATQVATERLASGAVALSDTDAPKPAPFQPEEKPSTSGKEVDK
jgi:hypothetical protein